MVFKSNKTKKYRYYLNFESYDFNFELLDIESGSFTLDGLFEINDFSSSSIDVAHINYSFSWIQMVKCEEDSQFMLSFYSYIYTDDTLSSYELRLWLIIFKLDQNRISKDGKMSVYSLYYRKYNRLAGKIPFNVKQRFYIIKIEKENMFYMTIIDENNYIYFMKIYFVENDWVVKYYQIAQIIENNFHKLLLIKENIFLFGYYSVANPPYYNYFYLYILKHLYDENQFTTLQAITIIVEYKEGVDVKHSDIVILSENKVAFVALKWHGRAVNIYILDYIDNYNNIIFNKFHINFYEQKIINKEQNSLFFRYKDLLGLHFENIEGEYGFILFGYFNSTDPKQIYDIKKDGLNYVINLGSYLTLQSNVFGYKKKCIRIVEVPNLNQSGIYLISNETKNMIKTDNCLNFNTEIKLNFAYNGIIKKGNYSFKFCGVLEEQTIEEISNYSESFEYLKEDFNGYNEQRNLNITGRVALVQINVLNDIRVFCDDKYKITSLKSKEGVSITCGDGKFFDIKNANEITQLDLGIKYYYDINNKIYIKCHERCKKCSREYNDTSMNCDECYENYLLLNGTCLEIPKCEYNYYYDIDLNLECINKDNFCPNFKPFENKETKECIAECDIIELNTKKCNPTNNPVSINETYKTIFNNIKYLNIEEKLLKNNEEFSIFGNNVSFIFSTTEIEKKNLYNIYNGSSIILNKCEDILKTKYSIPKENPIPILKIESSNPNSNNLEVFYELFNPNNFSEKLDINLCSQNYIEIRLPLLLKQYKMDLISKTRDLGYNIFDLNKSFYNDICSIFIYNNTDFSLSERKTLLDLSDENLTVPGCNYTSFDIKTIRTIYLCRIGNDINGNNSLSEIIINDNDDATFFVQLKKQKYFSKYSTLEIIKCFSIILNFRLFTENYGFYIMLFMNILNILLFVFSFSKDLEKKLNAFCNTILSQMKKFYNKKPNETMPKLMKIVI